MEQLIACISPTLDWKTLAYIQSPSVAKYQSEKKKCGNTEMKKCNVSSFSPGERGFKGTLDREDVLYPLLRVHTNH